jgi:hypothetical protein
MPLAGSPDDVLISRRLPVVEGGANRGAAIPDGAGDEGAAVLLDGAYRQAVQFVVGELVEAGANEAEADDVERRRIHQLDAGRRLDPARKGGRVVHAALDQRAIPGPTEGLERTPGGEPAEAARHFRHVREGIPAGAAERHRRHRQRRPRAGWPPSRTKAKPLS